MKKCKRKKGTFGIDGTIAAVATGIQTALSVGQMIAQNKLAESQLEAQKSMANENLIQQEKNYQRQYNIQKNSANINNTLEASKQDTSIYDSLRNEYKYGGMKKCRKKGLGGTSLNNAGAWEMTPQRYANLIGSIGNLVNGAIQGFGGLAIAKNQMKGEEEVARINAKTADLQNRYAYSPSTMI